MGQETCDGGHDGTLLCVYPGWGVLQGLLVLCIHKITHWYCCPGDQPTNYFHIKGGLLKDVWYKCEKVDLLQTDSRNFGIFEKTVQLQFIQSKNSNISFSNLKLSDSTIVVPLFTTLF